MGRWEDGKMGRWEDGEMLGRAMGSSPGKRLRGKWARGSAFRRDGIDEGE